MVAWIGDRFAEASGDGAVRRLSDRSHPFGRWFTAARPEGTRRYRIGMAHLSDDRIVPPPPDLPVLVVDDEPSIRDVVSSCLALAGYRVEQVERGWQAMAAARDRSFCAVLLDVNLPDTTGFEVCEQLRRSGITTPVMFLTARESGQDAAHGIRLGGDDYVRKPFDLVELVARVDRLVGRSSAANPEHEVLKVSDVEVDLGAMVARRGGVELHLTPTELRLLEVLARNKGQILTRYQLLDLVWGDDDRDPALVDTVVSRLRRKLDQRGAPILTTRRGFGYGLAVPG